MGFLDAIPIVGDVVKGVFGHKAADDAYDRQANQAAADRELQKEFAQHGVQWRVEDALKAGIHPLAALGMNPISSTPIPIGVTPDDSFAQMGQDLSRSVYASMSGESRMQAKLDALKLERGELENMLLASQIAKLNGQVGPPMPTGIQVNPSEITTSRSGDASMELAPPAPAVKEFLNRDGSVTIWPSADAKQAIEDSMYEWEHMWRNRVIPSARDAFRDFQGWWTREVVR